MLVQVQEEYALILQALNESIDEAIRQFALDKIQQRLLKLEQNVQRWEQKYGCSYDLFAYRTAVDEDFVNQLEQLNGQQDWEGDLFEWEVDAKELTKWRLHLQQLLIE